MTILDTFEENVGSVIMDCTGIILHYIACLLIQVTIYRRLWIGGDGYLDQSEAYDIS